MNKRRYARWAAALAVVVALALMAPAGAGASPVVGPTITGFGTALVGVAVDQSANRIYVADLKTNMLFAVDGETNEVVGSVAVPSGPREIAADPQSHRVYVTVGDGMAVVDGLAMKVTGQL